MIQERSLAMVIIEVSLMAGIGGMLTGIAAIIGAIAGWKRR